MRRLGFRTHLVLSYLALLVLVGAAMFAALEFTAPAFFRGHAEEMARDYGDAEVAGMVEELQRGFARAFTRAGLVAVALAVPVALVLSAWLSRRVLAPVRGASRASARIAAGHYEERLSETLGDELGELERNFNRMAQALQETEARRVELIGVVAHELRTPLVGVRGYAEALTDGVFDARRAAPEIIREVRRLERLVDDLSLLTRAESGAIAMAPVPTDLAEVARSSCARLEPLFREKGLALTVTARDAVVARADPDRLVQVLVNLLSNALRHTPAGGATVRVSRRDGRATVEVIDTGSGIAAEDLPHVFERFYRGEKSRARHDDGVGAGIGLTVSRSLVEAMGGRLELSSEPGGTVAAVTLPLHE